MAIKSYCIYCHCLTSIIIFDHLNIFMHFTCFLASLHSNLFEDLLRLITLNHKNDKLLQQHFCCKLRLALVMRDESMINMLRMFEASGLNNILYCNFQMSETFLNELFETTKIEHWSVMCTVQGSNL